ncbi:MAG: DUF3179 domain-containing protein [Opitutales bacterium]
MDHTSKNTPQALHFAFQKLRHFSTKYTTGLPLLSLPLLGLILLASTLSTGAQTRLGFDISNATIPEKEIRRGGPPPDGIPSIDQPQFTPAHAVNFLQDDDIVIGFIHEGEVRAYPFRILTWHEIVNDTVGGLPVAVTYCPLCGTAMIVQRRFDETTLTFGVSGLLYNSDVLMFDRETDSLWSQLGLKSVSGKYVGTEMQWLPSEQMTWAAWKERYPESQVLNLNTGHRRDYFNLPYASYFLSRGTMFPYERNRSDLEPKVWVAGVRHSGAEKAYPLEQLPSGKWLKDTIGEASVTLRYTAENGHFEIRDAQGKVLPAVHVFWFAWQAFYPETALWSR